MNEFSIGLLAGPGFAGIAALSFAEKIIPVVPSYVLFVFLGMSVVQNPADLSLAAIASTLGSVAGALVWYSLGRILGGERADRFVDRIGRYALLPSELYRELAKAYGRSHFWVTAAAQIVPIARIYLAFPAGVLGLPLPSFLIATALGSLAWNTSLLSLGHVLRSSGWEAGSLGLMLCLAIVAFEFVALAVGVRKRHRQSALGRENRHVAR